MNHALLRTTMLLIGQVLGCSWLPMRAPAASHELPPRSDRIPRTYFGIHIHDATTLKAWPAIGFGSWRLWDSHTTWSAVEPRADVWDFAHLDSLVDIARRRGIRVMLTLGQTPAWASSKPTVSSPYGAGAPAMPSDLATWRRYVRTIARRYRGRIEAYEIWNEPDLREFFDGSPADLVALARTASEEIRASDQDALIVGPSPSGERGLDWLEHYLNEGGNHYLDVLGFHAYVSPQPPEATLRIVSRLRAMADDAGLRRVPLWNTELGYSIATRDSVERPAWARRGIYARVLEPDVAAAFIARAYTLNWAAGASRLYWYDLDGRYLGLLEPSNAALKPAARAYAVVSRWLVNARLSSCDEGAAGVWECKLILADERRAEIVWRPAGGSAWAVPSAFRHGEVVALDGARSRIVDGAIVVGPQPSLIAAE